MRCIAVCSARQYQLNLIANNARSRGYQVNFHRNILHVTDAEQDFDLFFFQDGCFVYWGSKRNQGYALINELNQYAKQSLQAVEVDYFLVRSAQETSVSSHQRFNIDMIYLESDNPSIKLAVSYAIAQSVKIESFETAITRTIKKNRDLPYELSETGKIKLSRRKLSQRMGDIFIVRTLVNLNSEFLYVPKYFWQNPRLENYYVKFTDFLDVNSRVESLNKKLDALHETLDILSTELQHRHSSLLELIIILLIFIEIVLTLIKWH